VESNSKQSCHLYGLKAAAGDADLCINSFGPSPNGVSFEQSIDRQQPEGGYAYTWYDFSCSIPSPSLSPTPTSTPSPITPAESLSTCGVKGESRTENDVYLSNKSLEQCAAHCLGLSNSQSTCIVYGLGDLGFGPICANSYAVRSSGQSLDQTVDRNPAG
jgi:hypothetical protein